MLSILIPSRNEEEIVSFVAAIEKLIAPDEIIVYNDRYGRGKGYALKEALKEARGDSFIFIDGDWDIKPYELKKVLTYLKQYDIVVGRKQLPIRKDRKLLTFLSRLWIKLLFSLDVDTQTGIKGFNYRPSWNTNGWAFDIEILYKAKQENRTMIEIPVKATISDKKTIKDIWLTLLETLKIRFQL